MRYLDVAIFRCCDIIFGTQTFKVSVMIHPLMFLCNSFEKCSHKSSVCVCMLFSCVCGAGNIGKQRTLYFACECFSLLLFFVFVEYYWCYLVSESVK